MTESSTGEKFTTNRNLLLSTSIRPSCRFYDGARVAAGDIKSPVTMLAEKRRNMVYSLCPQAIKTLMWKMTLKQCPRHGELMAQVEDMRNNAKLWPQEG